MNAADRLRYTHIARFGAFELNTETGELRKSGMRIAVQDQPLQILRILVERAGEVVSREELRKTLWPTGTFVDFEHSLNSAVNKLRSTLLDVSNAPRFIETVPRAGYRFVAPVQWLQSAQEAETAQPAIEAPDTAPPPITPARRWLSQRKKTIAAGIVLVLIGGTAAAVRLSRNPLEHAPLTVVPLTSTPGVELQPTFSPDGNYVAYAGGPGGILSPDVYIKQIGSEEVRRLTFDPAPDISPKWSPDGRYIAFVRRTGNEEPAAAAVLIQPALGGAEHRVADIWMNVIHSFMGEWLLDWFPDSERIVVADRGPKGEGYSLHSINVKTGERKRLTTAGAAGLSDLDPAVSPSGKKLAFARHAGRMPTIYTLDMDLPHGSAAEPRQVIFEAPSRGPVWTPDGREIIFAMGPQHRKRLAKIGFNPVSKPQPIPLATEGNTALLAAISRNWQLTYPTWYADTDIYRAEVRATGEAVRKEKFLSSTFVDHLPEYSPDGTRVVFVTNRSGSQQLWLSNSDGTNLHQLTAISNGEALWPRWSPDGRRLIFSSANRLSVVDVERAPSTVTVLPEIEAVAADWGHDGKTLYFASRRTGRTEIWKASDVNRVSSAGLVQVQVTRSGGGVPRCSPAGDFIYYAKGSVMPELWRVRPDGSGEERFLKGLTTDGNFVINQTGIYFISDQGQPPTFHIVFVEPRKGLRKVVTTLDGLPMWGLSVHPNGRCLLYSQGTLPEADLMIAENLR